MRTFAGAAKRSAGPSICSASSAAIERALALVYEVLMTNRAFSNIAAAVAVACAAGVIAAILTPSLAQGLPNGEGKELVRRICARCHDLSPITSTGLSRREWDMVLDS